MSDKHKEYMSKLGRINFEGYNKRAKGLTWDKRPIPAWENLTEEIRQNWISGAEEVYREAAVGLVQL